MAVVVALSVWMAQHVVDVYLCITWPSFACNKVGLTRLRNPEALILDSHGFSKLGSLFGPLTSHGTYYSGYPERDPNFRTTHNARSLHPQTLVLRLF